MESYVSSIGSRLQMLTTSDHASVVSMNLFVALLCACIVIGHLLEENRWMNESITALIIVSFSLLELLNPFLCYCLYLKWDWHISLNVFVLFLCMVIGFHDLGYELVVYKRKGKKKEVLVQVIFFVCSFYLWLEVCLILCVWCFVDWWQGLCTGVVILLISGGKSSHLLVFSEDLFFIYLLPPIIFNAGYVYVPLNLNGVAFKNQCSFSRPKLMFFGFVLNLTLVVLYHAFLVTRWVPSILSLDWKIVHYLTFVKWFVWLSTGLSSSCLDLMFDLYFFSHLSDYQVSG